MINLIMKGGVGGLAVTYCANGSSKSGSLLRLREERAFFECELLLSRQSPHLEWGSWRGGVILNTLAAVMLLKTAGWTKTWFLMEMMRIYFQYFTAHRWALEAPCCLHPAVACCLKLIWQGWSIELKLHFFCFCSSFRGKRRCTFLYSVSTM